MNRMCILFKHEQCNFLATKGVCIHTSQFEKNEPLIDGKCAWKGILKQSAFVGDQFFYQWSATEYFSGQIENVRPATSQQILGNRKTNEVL